MIQFKQCSKGQGPGGFKKLQEPFGLNTLPTVHKLFMSLLSYKWLLSLPVTIDC
jgi:hypothetical protein